jgi:hypothetical protein
VWPVTEAFRPLVAADSPALLLMLVVLGVAGGVFAVAATVHVLTEFQPEVSPVMLWSVPGLLMVLPLIAIATRFQNGLDGWVFGVALLLGYIGAVIVQSRRLLRQHH